MGVNELAFKLQAAIASLFTSQATDPRPTFALGTMTRRLIYLAPESLHRLKIPVLRIERNTERL
jgi:hypothetical protein